MYSTGRATVPMFLMPDRVPYQDVSFMLIVTTRLGLDYTATTNATGAFVMLGEPEPRSIWHTGKQAGGPRLA